MKTSRKRYSEEFKKEAIMRVMSQGSSSYKVSKELGVGQPTLCKWVKQFKQEGSNVLGSEKSELKRLRAKLKRVQDERDILKKTVSFFARQEG